MFTLNAKQLKAAAEFAQAAGEPNLEFTIHYFTSMLDEGSDETAPAGWYICEATYEEEGFFYLEP